MKNSRSNLFTQALSAKSQNLKMKFSSFMAHTQQKVFLKYTNATSSFIKQPQSNNTLERQ